MIKGSESFICCRELPFLFIVKGKTKGKTMFDFIYKAIGSLLAWFDSFLGSYLLAILLFSLIIKILMIPFGIKQQKNMQKQASLRPKEMAIRKKYKGRENDQAAQQQMQAEVQEMYRENNYNVFGGCLPLLIQLPIILVVYQAIYRPLSHIVKFGNDTVTELLKYFNTSSELDAASKLGLLLKDPSSTDYKMLLESTVLSDTSKAEVFAQGVQESIPNFSLGSLNLGQIPGQVWGWLIFIPLLVFGFQIASMKLNRMLSYQPVMNPNQGCSNWIMDITMPAMQMVMAFMFPALLGIYWIFQIILGVLQQYILKKLMPMPTFKKGFSSLNLSRKAKSCSFPLKSHAIITSLFIVCSSYDLS